MKPLFARRLVPIAALLSAMIVMVAGCGGGGSGASSLSADSNPAVAAQVDEIRPSEDGESVAVFVELDSTDPAAAASLSPAVDVQRAAQDKFLADLALHAARPLSAASTSSCSGESLQTRLSQAKRPSSGTAVRIELNSCELDLLPKMRSVRGVHVDVPLTTQAASDTTALHQAIVQSFDGQNAWPVIAGQTLSGSGRVIAVVDTGVDGSHPALGTTKVLQGACFSTASNGGIGFCPNGASSDTSSANAGRSCVNAMNSRSAALSAGCGHGTGMAAVAAMDYSSVATDRGGVAKSAAILPVQVFSASARGAISASSGDLLAAIEWITEQARLRRERGEAPIAAVNMSLGGGAYAGVCDSDYVGGLFRTAFSRLRAQGVIPVIAAGNGGNNGDGASSRSISFPACVTGALPVAAAKLDYAELASYSNFSDLVRIVAIGGDSDGAYRIPTPCASTTVFDCWSTAMGTSPATALVSGAVAALHALQTSADPAALEAALTAAATGDSRARSVRGVTALRTTLSAERLTGSTATPPSGSGSSGSGSSGGGSSGSGSSGGGSSGSGGADTVTKPGTRICVYAKANYEGKSACAVVRMTSGDAPVVYNYFGTVRSVSIRDAGSGLPVNNRIKVTLYTSLLPWNYDTLTVTEDSPRILGRSLNQLVRSVEVAPLP